jgi:competence protein ComEA
VGIRSPGPRHLRDQGVDDGAMPELSRTQLLVYGAIAVALLLVGARWIRSADAGASSDGGVESQSASDGGSFEVHRGGEAVVHVAGAVEHPGVYRLASGSRVTDAVERAGGPTAAADPNAINLAAPLADGQQVVVPEKAPAGSAAVASSSATDGPISLGTATVTDLDTIEGIGPVTAGDIIEFRDQHGVSSIDDLDQISGIGPATMQALRGSLQP